MSGAKSGCRDGDIGRGRGGGGGRERRRMEAGTEAEPKTDGSGGGDGGVARRAPYHVGRREGGIGD